jgi:hypothetical protein
MRSHLAVIADFADLFGDGIAQQTVLDGVGHEELGEVGRPLLRGSIEPGEHVLGIVQDDGHAVVEKVELLVAIGRDDRKGPQLLLFAFVAVRRSQCCCYDVQGRG